MIKLSKADKVEIEKSGFVPKYGFLKSSKKSKYRYMVELDYDKYLEFIKNKK